MKFLSFKKKEPVPDPVYLGWYDLDYDSAKTVDDLKAIMKLSWLGVKITTPQGYKRWKKAIDDKILIKKTN